MPAMRPKTRDDLTMVEFEDEVVVLTGHGDHAHVHYLDPAATLVFRLCDGTATAAETAAQLAEVSGQPEDVLERQVRELTRTFRRAGLLTAKPVIRRPKPVAHEEHGGNGDAHDHDHDHQHGAVVDERGRIRKEVPRND